MDACSIWAFIAIGAVTLLGYVLRQSFKAKDVAMEIRMEEAKADIEMTNAIERLAEQIKELRHLITKDAA